MKAKDIMNRDVITVKAEQSIQDAAKMLLENKISGMPVIDDEGRVVGIISEADLIYREKNIHTPGFVSILQGIVFLESMKSMENQIRKIAASKVEDVMTAKVIVVKEDTKTEDIVDLMLEKRINRVPVVNDDGNLVGIVTRSDILKHII
ncbi:MAG: CBS domain-containing protein [Bacillota bacterium]